MGPVSMNSGLRILWTTANSIVEGPKIRAETAKARQTRAGSRSGVLPGKLNILLQHEPVNYDSSGLHATSIFRMRHPDHALARYSSSPIRGLCGASVPLLHSPFNHIYIESLDLLASLHFPSLGVDGLAVGIEDARDARSG